jgi:predicted metal-binding membrane protein
VAVTGTHLGRLAAGTPRARRLRAQGSLSPAALRRRPAIAWEATAVVAWLLLLGHVVASPVHHGLDLHHRAAGAATPYSAGPDGLAMWALMVVAMMLPAALPGVRHVASKSFRWRRQRAMAEFVAVYLGIWALFGAVVLAALAWWAPAPPVTATAPLLAAALAVAAAWQLTGAKRRALVRCHRPWPLPPRGWAADAGVARFAAHNGAACVASCWAMMLVMAVATTGELAWMVVITGIVSAEKLARKPRRATRWAAAALGVAALGVGALALLG